MLQRALDAEARVRSRAMRARLLARRGAFAEAERIAREAVALVEMSDSTTSMSVLMRSRPRRVLRACRDMPGATAAVNEACSLFEQKGNLVAAARARALIEELRDEMVDGPEGAARRLADSAGGVMIAAHATQEVT